MKFSEIKYQRVDIDKFKSDIDTLVEEFKKANSYDKEKEIFDKVNQIRKNFDTQANIVQIRFSINTQDEFYKKENEYMDKITPLFEESVDNFISAFLESKNLDKFAEDYGSVMVNKFRKLKRVFSKDIIEDLQEENKLSSEYTSILSNMTFEFEGKKLNQESIFAMFSLNEKDRRKAAFETFSREFEKNKEKIQSIYDSLVKVRHKMAKKLGYENFVQMGYDRLLRVDYDKEDVKKYREYIKKYVLDYCIKLNDIRAKHFNLDKIHYYDDELTFLSGDPKPESEYKKLVPRASKMYHKMSKETGEFFDILNECELMDLYTKEGKSPGGYCTFLEDYKLPFIFSNFNGTSEDVSVLTHEFGHAFQSYTSRNVEPLDLRFPGYEGAEIHSMTMELLALPYMDMLFDTKEEAKNYKLSNIDVNMRVMSYIATIDEFQHFVYENPEVTPDERDAMYREIQRKYTPWVDYEDNKYLESGGLWHRQGHVFHAPFYYIDYALAYNISMQLNARYIEDRERGFSDYLKLCQIGGSKNFLEIIESVDLKSPFDESSLPEGLKALYREFEEIYNE